MKIILVHVTEYVDFVSEDQVRMMDSREEACSYCGRVASGVYAETTIRKVIEVDVVSQEIVELEMQLIHGFEFELVEKGRGLPS